MLEGSVQGLLALADQSIGRCVRQSHRASWGAALSGLAQQVGCKGDSPPLIPPRMQAGTAAPAWFQASHLKQSSCVPQPAERPRRAHRLFRAQPSSAACAPRPVCSPLASPLCAIRLARAPLCPRNLGPARANATPRCPDVQRRAAPRLGSRTPAHLIRALWRPRRRSRPGRRSSARLPSTTSHVGARRPAPAPAGAASRKHPPTRLFRLADPAEVLGRKQGQDGALYYVHYLDCECRPRCAVLQVASRVLIGAHTSPQATSAWTSGWRPASCSR